MLKPINTTTALLALALAQAGSGPMVLDVGNPAVDGRSYRGYRAVNRETAFAKDGSVESVRTYNLDQFIETWNGVPVLRVVVDDASGNPAKSFHTDNVLALGSMAPLHWERRDSAGRLTTADFDGVHVLLHRPDGAKDAYTLDSPAFLDTLTDAPLGAARLKPGETVRIPLFSPRGTPPAVRWETYRYQKDEPIRVGDKTLTARVIAREGPETHAMWFVDEPPFVVVSKSTHADGTKSMLEQMLVWTYR